jgi:hypothetical protein
MTANESRYDRLTRLTARGVYSLEDLIEEGDADAMRVARERFPSSFITRKTHQRGQHVTATFRDRTPDITGRIDGWGPQILSIRPDHDHGGRFTWKREDFWTGNVVTVTAAS